MNPRTKEQKDHRNILDKIWRAKNKKRLSIAYKKWPSYKRYHTPIGRMKSNLQTKYGISLLNYISLLESQSNKCAICGEQHKDDKKLQVDHEHISGKVRGLLCKNCNCVLGFSRDNIERLEKAAQYLRAWNN